MAEGAQERSAQAEGATEEGDAPQLPPESRRADSRTRIPWPYSGSELTTRAWREEALARATEIETLSKWISDLQCHQPDSPDSGFQAAWGVG